MLCITLCSYLYEVYAVVLASSVIGADSFVSASCAISTNPLSFLSSFFYPSFFPIAFITFPVQNVN